MTRNDEILCVVDEKIPNSLVWRMIDRIKTDGVM